MNMKRCEKCGNTYDAEYPVCPHCSAGIAEEECDITQSYASYSSNMPFGTDAGSGPEPDVTWGRDLYGGDTSQDAYADNLMQANGVVPTASAGFEFMGAQDYDDDKTQSFYSVKRVGKEFSLEPAVGWLVCLKGKNIGRDYRLCTGKNYIGRSESMDVALKGEPTVSRDKHAILLFEPKQSIFLVQPGESKELAYLNDELILQPQVLKNGDIITVGEVDLLFVPLCSKDGFQWRQLQKADRIGEKEHDEGI